MDLEHPDETEHRKAEMFELRPTAERQGDRVRPRRRRQEQQGPADQFDPISTRMGRGMKTPVTQTGPGSRRGLR
jgi:hypothetical protein